MTTSERVCLGCGVPLVGGNATGEHALPQWLAEEIKVPNTSLEHFLHDEDKTEDQLLRSHGLNGLKVKKLCGDCNNGWMSRLENQAKRHVLGLMHLKTGILTLSDEARITVARWATKTAFMITAVQSIQFGLPWELFQELRKSENTCPSDCLVFAFQHENLPKGFLYACPSDFLSEGQTIQVRVGYSIHNLHFVVVIPIVKGLRTVRIAAGVHVPLWPLDLNVLACFKPCPPSFDKAHRFLDYLTNLIEVGVVHKKTVVGWELVQT
jgi:hypothetical protein